ncbi:MAG: methyltransferase domain-containing protein [Betaproteobacteria bacterium]|nr:methyltransferase domain-containing protein [Betaproteobacteria bacterium]
MAQDSSRPDFWDSRYAAGVTPWDARGAPPMLEAWIAAHPDRLQGARVLVPGCGSGYEVRCFARAGCEVLAIDFSDAALQAAQRELGDLAHLARKGDFFGFEGDDVPFDFIYERALLCALPRRVWTDWGRRVAALLPAGALLAGFFYFDDNAKGPPFGTDAGALRALLDPGFVRIEDRIVPAEQCLPMFAGKERWQLWRRRSSTPGEAPPGSPRASEQADGSH